MNYIPYIAFEILSLVKKQNIWANNAIIKNSPRLSNKHYNSRHDRLLLNCWSGLSRRLPKHYWLFAVAFGCLPEGER